eukprot:13678699-Alexandrium_andersonii.AAC.1
MAFIQPRRCIVPTLRVVLQPGQKLKGHPPPALAMGLAGSCRPCWHWLHLSRQGIAGSAGPGSGSSA